MSADSAEDNLARVIHYHDRTKHDFNRSARGPGYLDWANQPDPFRRYDGAPLYLLPLDESEPATPYESLYARAVKPRALDVHSLGWFLECSLGVSATKSAGGSTWKLRCNPSSGNLHPTEGYVLAPALSELSETPGVYHYRADEHALEQRCALSADAWNALANEFPAGTFFAGLSSIHWREAWKYGERAFRYCNHDVGHALGALRYAAAALGWRCVLLRGLSDGDIASLLGLAQNDTAAEPEHPDLMIAIVTSEDDHSTPTMLATETYTAGSDWRGTPNALSDEHVDWAVIGETAAACIKPRTETAPHTITTNTRAITASHITEITAGRIFRQRRSAIDMDGVSTLSREVFYTMLERVMPRDGRPPFDVWRYSPEIHLGLFVHRVENLAPGLYFLLRNAAHQDALKSEMRTDFIWAAPQDCPPHLPLYHLASGDGRGLAAQLSCMQSIAGAGAFSLGMIARFEAPLREHGAWFYPRLFWEAGLIGQALYLEAEAVGLRATGIGCYFDDPVHRVFGLRGHAFQSLYHFTIGGPVDDPRLTNLPPYSAERRARRGWV